MRKKGLSGGPVLLTGTMRDQSLRRVCLLSHALLQPVNLLCPFQWDAFSMPELHNFLRILQREEEEHLRQILQKYSRCRQKIQEALHACPLG